MSRLAALLTRWACAALSLAALSLGAVGCHDSPSGPGFAAPPPSIPSLEPVPFEAIGSGKVAFERIGNISADLCCIFTVYVIDAVARTTTHILDTTSFAGPAMSPDGQAIAYEAFTDNTTEFDVYVRGIDGAQPRRISDFGGQEGPPSWTPDGSAIVLTGSSDNLLWNVYAQLATAAATDAPRELASFEAGPGGALNCPVIFSNDVPVSVSTSGTLAFSCTGSEIDVVSATGSLAAGYDPPVSNRGIRYNVLEPVWSPDGTRLAFMRARSDSATGYSLDRIAVMVMAADGDSAATIVSVAAAGVLGAGWDGPNNASLCWMPNGDRIVFNVPEDTYVSHLWVVKADGTGLTKPTTASGAYDRSVSCGR